MAPFKKCFKTVALLKKCRVQIRSYFCLVFGHFSHSGCFRKILLINFTHTSNKLLKHWISAKFWLKEGYVQGALLKELHIPLFIEPFETATLGRSCS